MKIVDVAEFYAERGGGVRTYIDQKLRAAAEHGHELLIIAPGERDAVEKRLGSRIAWVASPPLPVDPRYRLLLRERAVHELLDQAAPDLIEGSSPWSGGLFVARYRGPSNGVRRVRKAFVFHQDPIAVYPQTLFGRWLGTRRVDALCGGYWSYLRRLSGRFDATVVAGAWLAERLEGHGIKRPLTVPFGVDKALFSAARPDPMLRSELLARAQAHPQATLLVTVSRHHPEKRLGTLLKALRLLAARRPIALAVYGDGPLAYWSAYRARGLPVYLAGATRDRELLGRVLASSDALLHGSSAETFGLVVAEALCAGLPLVVPDAGGAAELARPEYAELYPAGDADACAAAVERLLARDRSALGQASRHAGEILVLSQTEHFRRLFTAYASLLQC
jgi:alpha-1,6-mannosyltransferase